MVFIWHHSDKPRELCVGTRKLPPETQTWFLSHNLSLKRFLWKLLAKFSGHLRKVRKHPGDMSPSSLPFVPYVKELTNLAFPRSLIQNSLFRTESDLHGTYCSQPNSSVNQSTVPKSISFGRCCQVYSKNREQSSLGDRGELSRLLAC